MQYSRTGAQSKALLHVIADRLEREFTIEDLEEWTEYEVRVQAINGIGAGPWSQPVRGRTRESGKEKPGFRRLSIYGSSSQTVEPELSFHNMEWKNISMITYVELNACLKSFIIYSMWTQDFLLKQA